MTPLTKASIGVSVEISGFQGHEDLVVRLNEIGFTPGEGVRVVGRSLFKSPLFVEVRGAVVALREGEASCILIR